MKERGSYSQHHRIGNESIVRTEHLTYFSTSPISDSNKWINSFSSIFCILPNSKEQKRAANLIEQREELEIQILAARIGLTPPFHESVLDSYIPVVEPWKYKDKFDTFILSQKPNKPAKRSIGSIQNEDLHKGIKPDESAQENRETCATSNMENSSLGKRSESVPEDSTTSTNPIINEGQIATKMKLTQKELANIQMAILRRKQRQALKKINNASSTKNEELMSAPVIAYHMIENDYLEESNLSHLSTEDRAFLSNIVCMRTNGKFISPALPEAEYLKMINDVLVTKHIRKDNLLRWVYKKTLFDILGEFGYERNRRYDRKAFVDLVVKKYFIEGGNEIFELLNDTTFASKKKIKILFDHSPAFEKRFREYVNQDITSEAAIAKYRKMHKYCMKHLKASPGDLESPFIYKKYHFMPYRGSFVKEAIKLVNAI